ncbi:MAG: plasmid pRiA4b ORF-3 family protein [Bacteroidetes bacterium]|nr:plasmid pRiA4b ORF-3 family protein [Bacteroidota bacterium]MCL2302847.1 plasmid pRiA4b ORF-3 family protein [Lentimicrobiaceae bacterium]
MYYYKFKVSFDEVEDFERNIEILASDNFESFHQILYESIGLTGHELASFSICDSKWNKKQEITLIDMQDDRELETPTYDEEEEYSTSSNIPKYIMKDAVLKDFITDPHQHIMYEYDFIRPKVFYLELLKTLPVKENADYPRCVLSKGVLPKPDEHPASDPENDFLNDFLDEADEDAFDDDFTGDQTWDDSQSEFDSF